MGDQFKIINQRVILAKDLPELERVVGEHLAMGWQPAGPVKWRDGGGFWYQTWQKREHVSRSVKDWMEQAKARGDHIP